MNLIDYVNIKQGTKSTFRFSHGNTLPLTQLPFTMASFAPQTDGNRENWFYHPDDRSLEGIRLTHQPSVWLGDYGTLLFTPQTGKTPNNTINESWSSYRPKEAILRPDYLKMNFQRYNTDFELVPTERGAFIRLTYHKDDQNWLTIFPPIEGEYSYEYTNNEIIGSTTSRSSGDAVNFRMHFVLRFDKTTNIGEIKKHNGVIHIQILNRTVTAQLAISYIGSKQVLLNLKQDNSGINTFDEARESAAQTWEERLSRILVETETEEQKRTFYSCLYRVFLFPNKSYEINENGEAVHYSPKNGQTMKGKLYTNNGFWDTYRTVYPLFSLIAKDEYLEMLEGFIQYYKENGWLPRWPVMGETGCMPSTLIDAVIADAAVRGMISGELLETAFEGMLKHAEIESENPIYGRLGVNEYIKHGYVPNDSQKSSVNLTLDAAYGDFCIAEVAKILNKTEIESKYRKRALNYKNLFDAETGFMRGRDKDGNMSVDFNPLAWGGEYCEASAWQSTFNVPHDIDGLVELFGGKSNLITKLDALFAEPPDYNTDAYGTVIHESAEMAAVDFGQCAISNQPSFHIPFLFAALDVQEKTDYWVKKICDELFSANENGFPGDEDNGTMAAWYIFACLGLYPICPGKKEFVKSKMLLKRVLIMGKNL